MILKSDPGLFVFVKEDFRSQCCQISDCLFGEQCGPLFVFEKLENSLQVLVLPLEQLKVWCERIEGCNYGLFNGMDRQGRKPGQIISRHGGAFLVLNNKIVLQKSSLKLIKRFCMKMSQFL